LSTDSEPITVAESSIWNIGSLHIQLEDSWWGMFLDKFSEDCKSISDTVKANSHLKGKKVISDLEDKVDDMLLTEPVITEEHKTTVAKTDVSIESNRKMKISKNFLNPAKNYSKPEKNINVDLNHCSNVKPSKKALDQITNMKEELKEKLPKLEIQDITWEGFENLYSENKKEIIDTIKAEENKEAREYGLKFWPNDEEEIVCFNRELYNRENNKANVITIYR
jgi:hypothetical protein